MKTLLIAITSIVFVVILVVAVPLLWQQNSGPIPGISKSTTIIDLRNRGLSSLPAEIGEYIYATELLLDDNYLENALPAEIRKMTDLEVISAKNNQLTGIPAEIGQLRKLKLIDFSNNNISTYPNELLQLQQSFILDLTGNPFTAEQISVTRAEMPNATIRF